MSIEIEIAPELRAFINVLGDKINYEVETNGHFIEHEANKDNIAGSLLSLYNNRDNGYVIESQPVIESH